MYWSQDYTADGPQARFDVTTGVMPDAVAARGGPQLLEGAKDNYTHNKSGRYAKV
jgi:hypothetical protein